MGLAYSEIPMETGHGEQGLTAAPTSGVQQTPEALTRPAVPPQLDFASRLMETMERFQTQLMNKMDQQNARQDAKIAMLEKQNSGW